MLTQRFKGNCGDFRRRNTTREGRSWVLLGVRLSSGVSSRVRMLRLVMTRAQSARRHIYELGFLGANALPFIHHRRPFARHQGAACYLEPYFWFAQSGRYAAVTGMETDQ
jgi:hypothetical protein